MVPNEGDYQVLALKNDAQMLMRNPSGIELLSNVCRHRQARMLDGRGTTPSIVCPLHRWTYDLKGELLGAPHFPENPCLNLGRTPLQNWNGLLFDGPRDVARDLAALGVKDFDFNGYVFDRVETHRVNYNWKSFIEVYLEDYHVGPFHPGSASSSRATIFAGSSATGIRCRPSASTTSSPSRHAQVRALAQGRARLLSRRRAEARRDLAHVLPEHHARVVSRTCSSSAR
jgi:phenylpropionate dioxygenase-like ring-hydroxylating dioxygenase large terminal subunit